LKEKEKNSCQVLFGNEVINIYLFQI